MTNVKLYDNCDGILRPACLHCWCSISASDYIDWTETTVPATPATGEVVVFGCTDNKLYSKDDTGAVKDLTSSTGGATAFWEAGAAGWICPLNNCTICLNTGDCYCSSSLISTPCLRVPQSAGGFNRTRWFNNCLVFHTDACLRNAATNARYVPLTNDTLCWGINGKAWKSIVAKAFFGASDCNEKECFCEVDYDLIKKKFDANPIKTWRWKDNNEKRIGTTHQDFKSAYSDWTTVPDGGISLTQQNAILDCVLKALLHELKQLEAEIATI